MTMTVTSMLRASALVTLGLAIGAMGIYVGEVDDAPGAGGLGLIIMAAGVVLGVRAAQNRLSIWAGRTALAVGIVVAVLVAAVTQSVAAAAPLFPNAQAVPSVVGQAPAASDAPAAEGARTLVRTAMLEQRLPGVSVAVGAGNAIVWSEGFGWRDVVTETPVTPATRFHIGTAAAAVIPSVAPLGLARTGTDAAREWSPEAIGEEGEDFPPLTLLRHHVFQPLGLMPMEYPLPGERATFYVPRSDDHDTRDGRRLMYMRDLACCANGMAFSSTPSDLVRVAMTTNVGDVNGTLAGGMVTSIITRRDRGLVVAVTSNLAYADTASLAAGIADAFAGAR